MTREELFRQIVEQESDGILYSDREGIIRLWNAGAERVFGFSAAEALGASLDLIIPENLRARHWEGYFRVMASGETKYQTGLLSAPALKKDGTRISAEFSMVLVRGSSGEVVGTAAIVRDVTEKWAKEKGLRQRITALEAAQAEKD